MKKIRNKKLLIVSPTPSHPQNAGNRSRIFQFVSILKSLGFEIHFLYYNMESNSGHVSARPNVKAMKKEWDRFIFVPNSHPEILKRLSGLIVSASSNRASELKPKIDNLFFVILQISYFLTKSLLGLIVFITQLVISVDQLIGVLASKLLKTSPGAYRFLRKTFLGNRQSLLKKGTKKNADGKPPQVYKGTDNNTGKQKSIITGDNLVYNIDDWYNEGLDGILAHLHKKFGYGAVLVEYVFMSRALLVFPDNVLKVIDTHDLFTDRHLIYKNKGLKDNFFSTYLGEEVKGFERADLLIAIQDKERSVIEKMTYIPSVTVGHKVALHEPHIRNEGRYNILYLGAGNSSNIDGIDYFIENVLPLIAEKANNVKLVLAGNICKAVADVPHIKKLGEVKKVEDAYDEADIVINPGRVGTGLKIKNIESLGFGLPLVSTTHAAEGMDNDDNGFFVVDNADGFARACVKLLLDNELYNVVSNKAIEYTKKYNDDIDHRMKLLFCPNQGKCS